MSPKHSGSPDGGQCSNAYYISAYKFYGEHERRHCMKDLKSAVYEIEVHQRIIEDLKADILEATQNGAKYTQDEIDFFYWQTNLNVGIISKHDEARKFVRTQNPSPFEYVTECEHCHSEHTVMVTSRDKLNMLNSKSRHRPRVICDSCKDKEAKQIKRRSIEFDFENRKYLEDHKKLISLPYKDYLMSEHWRTFRAKAIKRYDGRCQLCNSKDKRLNVHHRSYENKGRENYTDVILLCEECHAKHHGK